MKTKFLHPSNPLLYKVAKKVKKSDLKKKWFLEIVRAMNKVAGVEQHADEARTVMVGLAAPQIGYSYQVVFANVLANANRKYSGSKNIFMINPRILSTGKTKKEEQEGCFSTQLEECEVRGIVSRSQNIKVEYMTLEGDLVTAEISGFPAVIVQHEVDHINGKVFVHRITNKKDLHIMFPSEYVEYKKRWKTWERNLDPKIYFTDVAKQ